MEHMPIYFAMAKVRTDKLQVVVCRMNQKKPASREGAFFLQVFGDGAPDSSYRAF